MWSVREVCVRTKAVTSPVAQVTLPKKQTSFFILLSALDSLLLHLFSWMISTLMENQLREMTRFSLVHSLKVLRASRS